MFILLSIKVLFAKEPWSDRGMDEKCTSIARVLTRYP